VLRRGCSLARRSPVVLRTSYFVLDAEGAAPDGLDLPGCDNLECIEEQGGNHYEASTRKGS